MANPIPGQEAIDNNDGTATTRYDDGSSVTWRIDTGQQVSSQPAGATGLLGTWGPSGFHYGASLGNYPGTSYGTPWNNPWSIGANVSEVPYGWGVPGFGQDPIKIRPEYLAYLQQMTTGQRGGYIPGSGTFNQFRLDQPGLLGPVVGSGSQNVVNLRYGLGGTGDPTTGLEPQTPDQWRDGPKAFHWEGMAGQGPLAGMDYLATLFGRPDAGRSGISTAAWSAPAEYWAGLANAVRQGLVKASPFGLQALAAKGHQVTPPGGAVDLEAAYGSNPARAGGGGGGGGGGGAGGAGGDSALQDYLASIQAMEQAKFAAQLAYQDWYQRTQDDEQAFQHAQQEWENVFNTKMFEYQQKKDVWALEQSAGYFNLDGQRIPTLQGIAQEAALTGRYNGAPTFQREQYESGVLQNLLGLQASLRGPENYGAYLRTLGSTPQGMRDVVNAAAGRFAMPSTSGMAGQPTAASLQSLLGDVTSGGAQAQADWTAALSGGLPAPNQISLSNWSKMLPTQQKTLLSAYESQGYDTQDVLKQLQQASPLGAVGGGGTAGTFRF